MLVVRSDRKADHRAPVTGAVFQFAAMEAKGVLGFRRESGRYEVGGRIVQIAYLYGLVPLSRFADSIPPLGGFTRGDGARERYLS